MKSRFILFFALTITTSIMAQKKGSYYNIPEAPKEYTAATVSSRMLDGLGFRYYWASYGLTEKDLTFKPSSEARTSLETLKHIYNLTTVILNSVIGKPNTGQKWPEMTFTELRKATLLNIEKASNILRNSKDVSKYNIVFKRGENTSQLPFWNQINGPISDALWHVGQVVTFRRSSGNPLPKGVNVLTGTKND